MRKHVRHTTRFTRFNFFQFIEAEQIVVVCQCDPFQGIRRGTPAL
jgi:hypothetical protein